MPNIYDRTYLRKQLRTRSFNCFRKKLHHICLRGSNYSSFAVSFWYMLNKVTWRYRISVLYRKATPTQVLSCKFLRSPFSREHIRWLLFEISNSNQPVQRCFNNISYAQLISDNLQLPQWQTNLKMHSLIKNLFQ